jgi:hypothetical protein
MLLLPPSRVNTSFAKNTKKIPLSGLHSEILVLNPWKTSS